MSDKPTMTLYRPHRGSLAAAMAEVEPCSSREQLEAICERAGVTFMWLKPYGFDSRIDWDTYIVLVDWGGYVAPLGFTNGPLPDAVLETFLVERAPHDFRAPYWCYICKFRTRRMGKHTVGWQLGPRPLLSKRHANFHILRHLASGDWPVTEEAGARMRAL